MQKITTAILRDLFRKHDIGFAASPEILDVDFLTHDDMKKILYNIYGYTGKWKLDEVTFFLENYFKPIKYLNQISDDSKESLIDIQNNIDSIKEATNKLSATNVETLSDNIQNVINKLEDLKEKTDEQVEIFNDRLEDENNFEQNIDDLDINPIDELTIENIINDPFNWILDHSTIVDKKPFSKQLIDIIDNVIIPQLNMENRKFVMIKLIDDF